MMRLWTGLSDDEELDEVDATGLGGSRRSLSPCAYVAADWAVKIPRDGPLRCEAFPGRELALGAS